MSPFSLEKIMGDFMKIALSEAQIAYDSGEVPVGAVIVRGECVLARAHNRCEELTDPTAHAEVLVIRAACEALKSKFLDGCELYVTLEPCSMCAGAVINSRISKLYFGAFEPETGACGSTVNLFLSTDAYKKTDVFIGDCADEASRLMKDFFKTKRM